MVAGNPGPCRADNQDMIPLRAPVPALLVVGLALAGNLCAARRPSPRPPAVAAAPAPGQSPVAGLLFGLPLDLNRASAADLAALPGVGPTRAHDILAERRARGGRFARVDDLAEVPGIGRRTLTRLRPLLVALP